MKNKYNTLALLTLVAFSLTACAQAPQSTEVDGAKVAKSAKDSSEKADAKEESKQDIQTVLKDFPRHVSWDFSKENNHLIIDADVTVPDASTRIYTGNVELENWEGSKKQDLTAKLLEAGLVSQSSPMEVYDDSQESVPQISISYADSDLLMKEKQGDTQKPTEEVSKKQEESLAQVFQEEGFSVKLNQDVSGGEGWDGSTYSINQYYEGISLANDFPATGTNEILNVGGTASFGEEQLISLDFSNMVQIQQTEECETLASADVIEASLREAVNHYEVMFSKGIQGVSMNLEYLVKNQGGALQLIPVWKVTFDTDGYYQYVEENPQEGETLSMMYLCINAIDGSIAYAA